MSQTYPSQDFIQLRIHQLQQVVLSPQKTEAAKTCFKTRYDTQRIALDTLPQIRKSMSGKKPVKAYWCKDCKGWHLTCLTKEKWEGGKSHKQKH